MYLLPFCIIGDKDTNTLVQLAAKPVKKCYFFRGETLTIKPLEEGKRLALRQGFQQLLTQPDGVARTAEYHVMIGLGEDENGKLVTVKRYFF